jgi:insulysin
LTQRYLNTQLNSPYRSSEYFWNLLLKYKKWSLEDRLIIIPTITLEDLQQHIKRLLYSFQVEGLIHGNITPEESKELVDQLFTIYKPFPALESEWPEERVIQLLTGKEYIYRCNVVNPEEENSVVYNYYQIGPENTRDDVLLNLFVQINKTTFYDQLRTKEQLGYIVWADAISSANIQGFRVIVQSSNYDPVHLDERIEASLLLAKVINRIVNKN